MNALMEIGLLYKIIHKLFKLREQTAIQLSNSVAIINDGSI